ncbi:hypothetical protein BHE74_00051253, partial [Ensete ventricosum]
AWKDDNRFSNRRFQAWKGGGFFSPRRGTTSRARNCGACAAIGNGFSTILRQIRRGKGDGYFCNRRYWCGKGGGFFSPRRLAVSRVRDAMDTGGQTRHSGSHTAPLFQWDPPLASSQRPPLVASQRNSLLQQPLVPSQREGVAPLQQPLVPLQQPLVTSQREGVAPL